MKTSFDKIAFSQLLRVAIGNRTQVAFAKDIQSSKWHISRMLNEKYDAAPDIETLHKIAFSSQGRVSYIQLLLAVGYINKIDLEALSPSMLLNMNKKDNTLIHSAIITALSHSEYEWTSKPTSEFDLGIEITDNPPSKWFFLCSSNTRSDHIDYQLKYNYFQLLKTPTNPMDKFSFATSNAEEFNTFNEYQPFNINANISLILIDNTTSEIITEKTILTNTLMPADNLLPFFM